MILLVVVVRARRRAVVRWGRSWPTGSEREQVRILRKNPVAMSRDEEKMQRTWWVGGGGDEAFAQGAELLADGWLDAAPRG